MKRLSLLFLIVFTFLLDVNSQKKTYLVLEAGPAWDICRVSDPGKTFSRSDVLSNVGGLSLWQDISENLSIGTGISYHNYLDGINMNDDRPHQVSWKSYQAILIPARISYRIQLAEFPLSLTPRVGYQFGLLLNAPEEYAISSLISDASGSVNNYIYNDNAATENYLHLMEVGLAADYRFSNNWQLSLAFSSYSGMKVLKTSDLQYLKSDGREYNAVYRSDGARLQTTFNVSIPVSNLWNNKDVRRHRHIENSRSGGSRIRNQRYLYFGGNAGALWRGFQTTNVAIGARPLEGRGIFRYSNLHTGIYMGYKFNSQTGLDIGAYYQRSSTFFSLMYDHEVDQVTKTSAPLFLEFPLTFRYFHDLYKQKLYFVPSVGASVLTHFSGTGYNAGTGSFEYAETTGNTNGTYTYTANRVHRFGFMLKVGAGLEYKLPLNLPLIATLNLNYSHGFRKIDEILISSSVNEVPAESSIAYSGKGWTSSLGIKMPILLGKDNRRCGAIPRSR